MKPCEPIPCEPVEERCITPPCPEPVCFHIDPTALDRWRAEGLIPMKVNP